MPMQTLYKLTNEFGDTRGNTHWAEGVTHSVPEKRRDANTKLCSSHYIHAYENPYVAIFMNPVHAIFRDPQLWEAKGEVIRRDGELKCGCFVLTTTRRLPLPVLSLAQRVKIAIYCAQLTPQSTEWHKWATKWLTGEDRTSQSATAAADAAAFAYDAAAVAAYDATATATYAADAAAFATAAAEAAANATDAAAYAYDAAAVAAYDAAATATNAYDAAAAAANDADASLISIINRVLAEGEV